MPARPLTLPRRGSPVFPDPRLLEPTADGLVALGGDLAPSTLVEAYSKGIFPWEGETPIPWFSPDPRCVIAPTSFRISRSLSKLDRGGRLRVTADVRFHEVMRGCASIHRPGQRGTWISERMIEAYTTLHELGIGHSIEVWDGDRLVGGLYGLALGRAFFGESMYSAVPSASKLALLRLCRTLARWDFAFVDCQQQTAHLKSLGAHTLARGEYLDQLDRAIDADHAWNPDGAALIVL